MMTLGESFDPLLTGRENAVTAGIVSGYTRREVERKLDEIVAFAELDEFFDHPIRTYSDGMRMRLAFAVAISNEPELMLIDEVLAVGDLRFQNKCFERLQELQERGATILLASHDQEQIAELCTRVLWLAHGRMQAYGTPEEVYDAYRDAMQAETERRLTTVAHSAPSETTTAENRFGYPGGRDRVRAYRPAARWQGRPRTGRCRCGSRSMSCRGRRFRTRSSASRYAE